MKFFVVAILLIVANAEINKKKPKCVIIRNSGYEEQILRRHVDDPFHLTMDYITNTLFFSKTAKSADTFRIAYINLNTLEYGLVSGIRGGFACAIDEDSHTIYMGGEDGIYKYNYTRNKATKMNTKSNVNIWQMFYKDKLYFTTFRNEKVYVLGQKDIEAISELKEKVTVFAVKNDGTYVYSNSSGLFTYNQTVQRYSPVGDYIVNGFTSDREGNLYFTTRTGIYYMNDKGNEVEELATFDNVYGVALDRNGSIIYAGDDSIIRLKPARGCGYENKTKFDE